MNESRDQIGIGRMSLHNYTDAVIARIQEAAIRGNTYEAIRLLRVLAQSLLEEAARLEGPSNAE